MAHTFDTKLRGSGNTDPEVMAYTCGANATLLVLGIVVGTDTSRIGGAPTYNGVAMTQIGVDGTTGSYMTELWYLISPATGAAHNISIPNSDEDGLYYIASSYNAGGGNTSALDVFGQTNNSSTTPSQTVTPTVNGAVIVDVMCSDDTSIPSANNQVLLYSTDDTDFSDNGQYALQAVAGAITLSWTTDDNAWSIIAGAFKTVAVAETSTDLLDGKIRIKDSATSLADGKVRIKDVATNNLDGEVKVIEVATNLADGRARIKDSVTSLADSKVQVKDVTTTLVDGKVSVGSYATSLLDGRAKIIEKITSVFDGKVGIQDKTTGIADGKLKVKDIVTSLLDGKVIVGLGINVTNYFDGLVRIKDKVLSLLDGKLRIGIPGPFKAVITDTMEYEATLTDKHEYVAAITDKQEYVAVIT